MCEHAIGKLKRWLLGRERDEPRSVARSKDPEVVMHYWDGSAAEGRRLRDISHSGAYIYTAERWYPGTIIRIILQGDRLQGDSTAHTTCVSARVVRHGSDGVAVEFAFRNEEELGSFRTFLAAIPPRPAPIAPPDARA